jgi:copper chaperone CopZ
VVLLANKGLAIEERSHRMKTVLRSEQLTCPSCVKKIEKALTSRDGVEKATVHFTTGRIEVEHDPERASREDLVKTVRDVGYVARPSSY